MKRAMQRQYLFRPITVLLVSLVAAVIFALFISLVFEGELRWFLLYYFTPIGIPFVAFLFDRAEQYKLIPKAAWAIDLAILIPALIRAFILIPFISGHAIFLVYCLLTTQSKIARITAILVLIQVVYLKIFVTHDTALFGGLIAGCLAALAYRWIKPAPKDVQIESES